MRFHSIAITAVFHLFVALMPSTARTESPAETASVLYENAISAYNAAEYRTAVIHLKNALQTDPGNLSARLLLGRVYLAAGDGAGAEKEIRLARRYGADYSAIVGDLGDAMIMQRKLHEVFEEFLVGNSTREIEVGVNLIRGRAFAELNELPEAAAAFKEAARLAPDAFEPMIGEAIVLLHEHQIAAAEDLADLAISVAPEEAEPWQLKGDIKRARGDSAAALENYDKALAIDPHLFSARLVRATLRVQLGEREAALKDIQEMLGTRPLEPQANFLHALTLAQVNDFERAQAAMKRARRGLDMFGPEYVDSHMPSLLLSATINFNSGVLERAEWELERYLQFIPRDARAQKMLGSIRLKNGDVLRAVRILEPALKSLPNDPQLLALLGSAYLQQRKFSRSTTLLEKAAELAPDLADIRIQLALGRLAVGHQREAVEELEAAISLDPSESKPGVMLGFLSLDRGDPDTALRVAKNLVRDFPDSPVGHNLAAAAHLQRHDIGAARHGYARALEVDPLNKSAHYSLAKLDLADGHREAARKRYEMMVNQIPRETGAMKELARLAEGDGRVDDAIRWLEKVRASDSSAVLEQQHLVELYLSNGRVSEGLAVANDLSFKYDDDSSVLITVGRARLADGNLGSAASTFRRAARFAGFDVDALHTIALLQIAARDRNGAKTTLEKALTADAAYLPAQASLVMLQTEIGNIGKALARAKRLAENYPSMALGHALAGDVSMAAGEFGQAVGYFSAAQGREPSSETAIRLYRAQQAAARDEPTQLEAAVEQLKEWARTHPEDFEVKRVLAAGYIRIGRLDTARDLHEKLLNIRPNDPAVLNNLATLYLKIGDTRALSYAERAFKLAPNEAITLDTYGWILVREGEPAKGIKYLREANDRRSGEPEIQYHLGVALARLGRDSEAKRQLEKALRRGHDFDGDDEARALLENLSGS
ncbi:MAG: PEP-CTERM system TPR-repeat protein PrsT [Gammaproteobacteria bacterium]|nr:PEP-CTERM system TPR-repeat protein PrsT [Gammaproteobacteria bacterium]